MILTEEKIAVSIEMLHRAGMTRGSQIGIPTQNGLDWKELEDLAESDYDALENYFLSPNQQSTDDPYQKLFHILQAHGVIATQSEMDEIAAACAPLQAKQECSDELAALLINLRTSQRSYFAAAHGTLAKQTALQESKKYEKELDAFLKARAEAKADPQTKLF